MNGKHCFLHTLSASSPKFPPYTHVFPVLYLNISSWTPSNISRPRQDKSTTKPSNTDTESLELAILLAQVKTSCDQIYSLSVHFLTILDKCPHVLTHHLMVPIHRHLRHLTEAEKVRASGPDSRIAYRNLLRADLADQRQYLFDWSRSLARWESEGRGQEVWVIMNRVAYWEERWNVNEWERSLIAWEERMGKMDLEEMADAHVEIREVMEQLCVFGGAVADQGWT